MIGLLISIIILAVVLYLIWWLISLLGLPEPILRVVTVCFVLIAILLLLGLLPIGGYPYHYALFR